MNEAVWPSISMVSIDKPVVLSGRPYKSVCSTTYDNVNLRNKIWSKKIQELF